MFPPPSRNRVSYHGGTQTPMLTAASRALAPSPVGRNLAFPLLCPARLQGSEWDPGCGMTAEKELQTHQRRRYQAKQRRRQNDSSTPLTAEAAARNCAQLQLFTILVVGLRLYESMRPLLFVAVVKEGLLLRQDPRASTHPVMLQKTAPLCAPGFTSRGLFAGGGSPPCHGYGRHPRCEIG
jgi:hypothetical protein